MPALVAGIHALLAGREKEGVDSRDKPGHDDALLQEALAPPACSVAGSTFTPGPMVEEIATRWI